MKRLILLTFISLMLAAGPALAVRPGEQLADPAQEARARRLSTELRCLVCQNQSIDDSDASLAVDLRRIVRERIAAGDSDQAIRDFLVARYGEFVLLKPTLSLQTILLWGLPGVALLLGAGAALSLFRRGRGGATQAVDGPPAEASLTDAERKELDDILSGKPRA